MHFVLPWAELETEQNIGVVPMLQSLFGLYGLTSFICNPSHLISATLYTQNPASSPYCFLSPFPITQCYITVTTFCQSEATPQVFGQWSQFKIQGLMFLKRPSRVSLNGGREIMQSPMSNWTGQSRGISVLRGQCLYTPPNQWGTRSSGLIWVR